MKTRIPADTPDTAQRDTVYSLGILDLRREPVVITVPDVPDGQAYLLQMGDVVGLLQQDLDSGQELRLMHRNGFPAEWLACHPDGTIATSVRQEDGTVLLAISETEGRHWNNVVGGDAVDQAGDLAREHGDTAKKGIDF